MSLEGLARVTVDLSLFDRLRVLARNPDLREAWKVSRKPLRADQRDHAKRTEGPSGAWPTRSSSTKTRTSGRKRARKLLGRLPGAMSISVQPSRMILASRVSWSEAQNAGGIVGHGARLPERRFVWASDKVLETIATIVAKGLAHMIEVT